METHTEDVSRRSLFIHAKILKTKKATKQERRLRKSIESIRSKQKLKLCAHTLTHIPPLTVTLGLLCVSALFLSASAEMKY